jgi:GT2 family glycosyltransferase
VALCTHNREARLARTLEALRALGLPKSSTELLIVDNASTDRTAQLLAGDRWRRPNWPARIVWEGKLGLSNARNRAIQEAAGEYIVFIDDDESPAPQWLVSYERAILSHRPDAFGGRIDVTFEEGDRPAWLTDELLGFIGKLDHGAEERFLTDRSTPIFGGNFGFRREIFARIGNFDAALGRRGTVNTGGEDTEIYRRMIDMSCTVLWVPKALIYHRIEASKLRRSYFLDLHFRQGRAEGQKKRGTGSRVPPKYLYPQLGRAVRAMLAQQIETGRVATLRKEMNVSYFLGYILGWLLD